MARSNFQRLEKVAEAKKTAAILTALKCKHLNPSNFAIFLEALAHFVDLNVAELKQNLKNAFSSPQLFNQYYDIITLADFNADDFNQEFRRIEREKYKSVDPNDDQQILAKFSSKIKPGPRNLTAEEEINLACYFRFLSIDKEVLPATEYLLLAMITESDRNLGRWRQWCLDYSVNFRDKSVKLPLSGNVKRASVRNMSLTNLEIFGQAPSLSNRRGCLGRKYQEVDETESTVRALRERVVERIVATPSADMEQQNKSEHQSKQTLFSQSEFSVTPQHDASQQREVCKMTLGALNGSQEAGNMFHRSRNFISAIQTPEHSSQVHSATRKTRSNLPTNDEQLQNKGRELMEAKTHGDIDNRERIHYTPANYTSSNSTYRPFLKLPAISPLLNNSSHSATLPSLQSVLQYRSPSRQFTGDGVETFQTSLNAHAPANSSNSDCTQSAPRNSKHDGQSPSLFLPPFKELSNSLHDDVQSRQAYQSTDPSHGLSSMAPKGLGTLRANGRITSDASLQPVDERRCKVSNRAKSVNSSHCASDDALLFDKVDEGISGFDKPGVKPTLVSESKAADTVEENDCVLSTNILRAGTKRQRALSNARMETGPDLTRNEREVVIASLENKQECATECEGSITEQNHVDQKLQKVSHSYENENARETKSSFTVFQKQKSEVVKEVDDSNLRVLNSIKRVDATPSTVPFVPKLLPESSIMQARYNDTWVFELDVNGILVMRRSSDSWINISQVLSAFVGDLKSEAFIILRDAIWHNENEMQEKIESGPAATRGVWIPLDRATKLMRDVKLYDLVAPLLDPTLTLKQEHIEKDHLEVDVMAWDESYLVIRDGETKKSKHASISGTEQESFASNSDTGVEVKSEFDSDSELRAVTNTKNLNAGSVEVASERRIRRPLIRLPATNYGENSKEAVVRKLDGMCDENSLDDRKEDTREMGSTCQAFLHDEQQASATLNNELTSLGSDQLELQDDETEHQHHTLSPAELRFIDELNNYVRLRVSGGSIDNLAYWSAFLDDAKNVQGNNSLDDLKKVIPVTIQDLIRNLIRRVAEQKFSDERQR